MSKKYLLVREEQSDCNVSIGCGIAVLEFTAENFSVAREKCSGLEENWQQKARNASIPNNYLDEMISSGYLSDVGCCCQVTLYEISQKDDNILNDPLKVNLGKVENFRKLLHREWQDAKERREYERLKRKFEG